MRFLLRVLFALPFATFALQWLLYFSFRSHGCAGRANLVRQRQAILCLTDPEQLVWNIVGWAVTISFGTLFAVIAVAAIVSLLRKGSDNSA